MGDLVPTIAAPHACDYFPSGTLSHGQTPPSATHRIRCLWKVIAWWIHGEATRLAGFKDEEARRFFGQRPVLATSIERDYLTPWPAETAERRFRERVVKLLEK